MFKIDSKLITNESYTQRENDRERVRYLLLVITLFFKSLHRK